MPDFENRSHTRIGRRIVTVHDARGKSRFGSQAEVPARSVTIESAGGTRLIELWATDDPLSLPVACQEDPTLGMASFTPGLHGSRFRLVEFAPAPEGAELDVEALLREFEEKAPGDWKLEPDAPGMHTTNTVDYGVVLSGEIQLFLDEGASVTLRPGDTIVQNGTRHAWHNPGPDPCLMAVVMIGTQRRK